MKESSKGKKIIKTVLIIFCVIILLAGGGFLALAATEFRPEDESGLSAYGTMSKELNPGDTISVMTWNIGYAGLGEEEDFFMDGGKRSRPDSVEEVTANLEGIENFILEQNPDIAFFQEVDADSSRSYYIDETKQIESVTPDYVHSYAQNFKVAFLPYPIPPMGKIDSGIQTVSRYGVTEAWRYQLPIPFTWPVRAFNLKRCLMLERIPIAGSDKELVLVNLHLEAYDSGEGKIAQTKALTDILEAEYEKGNYVIAGGDFNQTFSSVDLSRFPVLSEDYWAPGIIEESDFADHWQLLMDDSEPSCRSLDKPYVAGSDPKEFQHYVIDGFIVSDNIEVEDLSTINLGFKNSDHNPVTMQVTLK